MITRWSWRGKTHSRDRFVRDAGKRSRLRPPSRRLGTEMLEDRRMLYALSTGSGDGSLNVEVDGFGSFGGAVGGAQTGTAVYDPIGPIGPASTTFQSGVAVRFGTSGPRQFLTSGDILGSGGLPDPVITGSSTSATSNFTTGNLAVELTQSVAPMRNDADEQTGSLLTQSYRIQNVGASSVQFEIIRYIDGDLFFDGTLVDGGGRIVVSGLEFLFETDAGGSGSTDTTFVGIDANGGTIPQAGRFEVDSFAGLGLKIIAGTALDDIITGDNDGDGFVDVGQEYDITLALQNVFDLAAGASATYTTRTVFGSGTPEDVEIDLPAVEIGPDLALFEGDGGFTDFVFSVSLTEPTAVPITVAYATADGTATAPTDYVSQSGSLTFLPDGPNSHSVTIQVVADLAGEGDETFLVRLSDVTGGILGREEAIGTILNDDIEASINDIAVIEGNSGTANAVFTVSLIGLSSGTVNVGFATSDGTANGGSDFIPVGGTLAIPAQSASALVTVPIIGDQLNEGTEQFFVTLSGQGFVTIGKGTGIGTIIDNDPRPALYVNDVQVTTTEAGILEATFTVALDVPSGRTVSVEYTTVDGTARANVDYLPRSGVLQFPAGVNTLQVTVPVLTSDTYAPNELFFLEISNPVNALLADPVGVGTSVFGPLPPMEHFVDDGDPGYSHNAGWTNVTNLVAYQSDYDYHAPGTGAGAATWTFNSLLDGPYEVFTRWVQFSNRATNAPYTVLDGATPLGTVRVNQQLAPTGDHDNGISWQSLGMYEITSGTLRVRLTDDANGYVIADAVRIVRDGIPPQAPEIDVSQWGHSIGNNDLSSTLEDGTHFGNVLATAYSTTRTFTIKNTGNADLHLTGSPSVQLVGDHPGDFIVATQPSATVVPGGTTTFDVIFHPATTGPRRAIVSIGSDDADESLYRFAIEGIGADDLVALAPAQNVVQPLDVDANSVVSARDALLVINALLRETAPVDAVSPLAAIAAEPAAATLADPFYYLDVDGNGAISARDALLVINHLILQALQTSPPTTGPATSATTTVAVQVFVVDKAISLLTAPTMVVAPESASAAASEPAAIARPAPTKTLLSPANVQASFDTSDDDESEEELGWRFD